jgi:hypothetical protein
MSTIRLHERTTATPEDEKINIRANITSHGLSLE